MFVGSVLCPRPPSPYITDMRLREYKHDALSIRSSEKALRVSRRLVQSAKIRTRRPFHPELFARPADNVRMAQTTSVDIDIGRPLDPLHNNVFTVSIPETIQRPAMPPVMSDKIAQFEPELADVPVEYAREALASMGTKYVYTTVI